MSTQPTLYMVQPGSQTDQLSVEQVWAQSGSGPLAPGYSHLVPVTVGGVSYLIAVGSDGGQATAFRVQDSDPWLTPVDAKIDLGGTWDIIEPFVIGNQPHLLAYAAEHGQLAFFPVGDDLSLLSPYRYSRPHEPGSTAGFSVVKPITIFGAVYYLCYSFKNGTVSIYSLSVTATSPTGTPPLFSNYVWLHTWARNWTRFAFFQLGGENFFLKTNVGKLNVNIDHIQDDPSLGTVEVGTQLELENALELDIVRPFYLGGGDPYFLTYMKDGTTTFNRFQGDCQGWRTQARLTTVSEATQIVPIQFGTRCYVLFY
ncbi:MAG TPA: hypothetical protein VEW94_06290 [Chloroflexia bacterium]|nr:hypothetical protein [Chloroflexia bacterium]